MIIFVNLTTHKKFFDFMVLCMCYNKHIGAFSFGLNSWELLLTILSVILFFSSVLHIHCVMLRQRHKSLQRFSNLRGVNYPSDIEAFVTIETSSCNQ